MNILTIEMRDGSSVTPLARDYWARENDDWRYRLPKLADMHGLSHWTKVQKHNSKVTLRLPACVDCLSEIWEQRNVCSRKDADDKMSYPFIPFVCPPCREKRQVAAAAAMKVKEEQEAAQKAKDREERRKYLELRYGNLMTGVVCPECQNGFLIAKLNSTTMRVFLGCSSFNPYRYSCSYTQPLASDLQEQFMPTFRARLAEKEANAAPGAA